MLSPSSKRRSSRVDAVLPVNKPRGMTSRQTAATVARISRTRRAGHAGTLDPLATGVLVVCTGRATLLSSYLAGGTKRYLVAALLGVETDTYDTEGEAVNRREAGGVTLEDITAAAERLTGTYDQVPPPYSAVRRGGRRLYEYARRGESIPSVKREVSIGPIAVESLEDTEEGPVAVLDVACGPGTYVRSLVHDLGALLGCGGCVASLERTRSGAFGIEDCVGIDELEREGPEAYAMSMEQATRTMPSITVDEGLALAVSMGKKILVGQAEPPSGSTVFRVIDPQGRLVALHGPPREDDDEEIASRAVRVIRPYENGVSDDTA